MSDDVVGSASVSSLERMQWKIPYFFATAENGKQEKMMGSPLIWSSGCNWRIVFDPKRKEAGGKVAVCLGSEDKETFAKKTVTCYVGSEKAYFNEKLASEFNAANPTAKFWAFTPAFGLDELKRRKFELVPSGTLTITLFMEDIDSDPRKEEDTIRRLMGLENLSSSFEDLFVNKKKTDATLKVKEKDFPAHKLVLMGRSPVFSAMFVHDTSEEQTGVVTVPDCDPDSFQHFLRHLYTGKFDGVTSSNAHHLYVTSNKYDVQDLKSFCVNHMKQNLTMENILDVVALADRYEESKLLSSAQDFFNRHFVNVISTSRWRTLLKEDQELANRLLLQMGKKVKIAD